MEAELRARNRSHGKIKTAHRIILERNDYLVNELGDEKAKVFALNQELEAKQKEIKENHDLIMFYSLDHAENENIILRLKQKLTEAIDALDRQKVQQEIAVCTPPSDDIKVRIVSRKELPTFDKSDELGFGSFGKVYKMDKIVDGKLVNFAVKVQRRSVVKRIEVDILHLGLPGLVNCHDIFSFEDTIYMVLELYPYTLLSLQQYEETSIETIEALLDFTNQITASIQALHLHKIAHRDIKAENILAKRNQDNSITYVLADFGSCLSFCKTTCTQNCHPDEGYTRMYTELVISIDLGCESFTNRA